MAQGKIFKLTEKSDENISIINNHEETTEGDAMKNAGTNVICHEDFYKEFHLRGYQHQGAFRGVCSVNLDGNVIFVQPIFLTLATSISVSES